MEIIFSRRFQKQAKKLAENKPALKARINACIVDFSKYVRSSRFYRKRLKGEWYGYDELQIGGDIRVIVRIDSGEDRAVLERIGTHAQLGW